MRLKFNKYRLALIKIFFIVMYYLESKGVSHVMDTVINVMYIVLDAMD